MAVRFIFVLIFARAFLECQTTPFDVPGEKLHEGEVSHAATQELHGGEVRHAATQDLHGGEVSHEATQDLHGETGHHNVSTPEELEPESLMTGAHEHVPEIDPKRYVVLSETKPFPDGTDCGTGQEPLTAAEAKIVRKHYADLYQESNPNKERTAMYSTIVPDKTLMERGAKNCQSGKCNLDVPFMSYICGNLTQLNFVNGLSCIDGSEPRTPKEVLEERKSQRITKEVEEEINKDATKAYGLNCESGKCLYHFHRDVFICSAPPSLQPAAILCILTGFSLLHAIIQ